MHTNLAKVLFWIRLVHIREMEKDNRGEQDTSAGVARAIGYKCWHEWRGRGADMARAWRACPAPPAERRPHLWMRAGSRLSTGCMEK
eukprot:gene10642-biopygen12340